MSLTKLNSMTFQDDAPIRIYNCGGFALGNFDWYVPDSWHCFDRQPMSESFAYGDLLEQMAFDIESDHPYLTRIEDAEILRRLPKRFDLIGFRISTIRWGLEHGIDDNEDYEPDDVELDDFHFIRRHDGVWYTKNGGSPVRKLPLRSFRGCSNFEAEEFWNYRYDSKTIWFADTRRIRHPHLYEEAFFATVDEWDAEDEREAEESRKWREAWKFRTALDYAAKTKSTAIVSLACA